MATWSARTRDGLRSGLTVYQLQELVRTGVLAAEDEVSDGGEFQRVGEVERLARLLPADRPAPGGTLTIAGMPLEVGPDGRPVAPPDELVMKLLAQAVAREREEEAVSWRILYGIAAIVAVLLGLGALWFAAQVFLRPNP